MTTSTILRVKRKIEDNPQDALVLMCKRVKKDTEEISPSLFVFRGTVNNQENDIVRNVVPKTEIKLSTKHSVNDLIEKIRKEKKKVAQEYRYEVVKCSRGLKDIVESCEEMIDLVDLQRPTDEKSDVQYTYDLYVAAKQEDFDVSMLDNLVSIENYESTLIFGSHRDNGLAPSDDEQEDDDDSNDENNWRNEYPDTEDSSIDEEDMIKAMNKCDIEDDLSSDTGEDKIYEDDMEPFNEDVKRYGAAYAKYKARVLTEESENVSQGLIHYSRVKDIDEEHVEGYKSDSNDGFYYGEEEDTEQFREQYGDISSDEYSPD
ncbi:hypothetical protein ACJJTC_004553 [Scirpophaga incertulas]